MNPDTTDLQSPAESAGAESKLFLVTSLVFLALACLMLAGRPGFLLTPVLTGHGFSWLLLMLYGCGLSGIFGLVYRAFPKIFDVPLLSAKFVYLHYGFHIAGTLMAIASVLWSDAQRAQMATTFLAAGALIFVINLGGAFRNPSRPDVGRAYLAASMVWLVIMAFLGLPFAPEAPLPSLRGTDWSAAWLVFCFAGVVLNTLMGLSLRVAPKSLNIPEARSGTSWYALIFSNAGLAWMFPAIAFRSMGFLILCSSLYLVGTLLYLAAFLSQIQSRPKTSLPWDAKILVTSFWTVPVLACLLLVAAKARMIPAVAPVEGALPPPEPTGPLPVDFLPVDGALLLTTILAVMAPSVVALAFQFIRMDKPATSDPASRERLPELILLAAYFNYATGVLLVIPGAWAGIDRIVSLGTIFLLVGTLGFLGNFFYSQSAKRQKNPGICPPETVPTA